MIKLAKFCFDKVEHHSNNFPEEAMKATESGDFRLSDLSWKVKASCFVIFFRMMFWAIPLLLVCWLSPKVKKAIFHPDTPSCTS